MSEPVVWPHGKRFAFTVIDDTDSATLAAVAPIYALLTDLGFRTTKTVWPLRSREGTPLQGDTLEDAAYRRWILELQSAGFEIAYHGASAQPSERERSIRALDLFRDVTGADPRIYASHSGQLEAMYWGDARLSGLPRWMFATVNQLLGRKLAFQGEAEASRFFWGDLCRDRIEYTRNFTYNDIDTLACDPAMPYHDPSKPFVRFWFSSSNAAVGPDFCRLIREANQDRLAARGGACIVYTHFAYNFVVDGVLDPTFIRLMTRLASLGGWYVPASRLLDHLRTRPDWSGRADSQAIDALQWRWINDSLRSGTGRKYLRRFARRLGLPI